MLSIRNLSKKYGNNTVLHQVNLDIESGIGFGLIGPNGAGKSTLMKILCGILDDFDGEVSIFGMSLKKDLTKIQYRIGYVPQDICLEEKLSAMDNLKFFGSVYGLRGKELHRRAEEILELVGLANRRNEPVEKFSGGMKRRINIGCALLHSPDFIIMDEPTVGVDPQSRNYIFEIIKNLKAEGKTILYSSHYMEEVEDICDKLAIVDHGRILTTGGVQDILNQYSTPSIYIESQSVSEQELQQFGTVSKKANGYEIASIDVLNTLQAITDYLKQRGCEVNRLEISRPNLQEIFLSLTGSQLRD
jgi:ABC-2 type transport system ATP-binding protein